MRRFISPLNLPRQWDLGNKGPADFHFAPRFIASIKSRRTDDLSVLSINRNQSARFQRVPEELPEYILAVTIAIRMLLPNQRIGSYSVKLSKIQLTEITSYAVASTDLSTTGRTSTVP